MSLDDLIANLETINERPSDRRDIVVAQALQFLTKLRDVRDKLKPNVGDVGCVRSLNLPWKFVTGEPNEDIEGVDVKIRDSKNRPVVITDSGYYPPSAYCAEFIAACANGWNELFGEES